MTEYEISVLSPVHIGSGNEYGPMDFVVSGERVSYIAIDKVLDELIIKGKNTLLLYEALERYGKNFSLGMFLNNHGITIDSVTEYDLRCRESPSSIRGFFKNAFNIPLIPGSSIKGAIRTALTWYFLKDRKSEVEKIIEKVLREIDEVRERNRKIKKIRWWEGKIGNELENIIFYGKKNDAQFDIFKSMIVADASFETIDSLHIEKCKVLSTTKDYKMMLKSYDIYLEVLEPPTKSKIMEISLNNYFLEEKNQNLGYNTDQITLFKEFPRACNEFSKALTEYELAFFEQYNLPALHDYYINLFNTIPTTDNEFFLRVGYGIGWLSTTLGLLLKENAELLTKLRKTFYLGRRRNEPHFLPEYPKSRRIIFNNNDPIYPMGWMKLKKHKE